MKTTEIKVLFSEDLLGPVIPTHEVHVYSFKKSSLSKDELDKFTMIAFIDINGNMKILKNRWGSIGLVRWRN